MKRSNKSPEPMGVHNLIENDSIRQRGWWDKCRHHALYKETIGSGDGCPLKHQCYHFTSRGFLAWVPRAFHPPRRIEYGFPRIVVIHGASGNRLLLQEEKRKNTGFGDRHHPQWLTLWSQSGAAQIFSPHHSLTAAGERGERKAGLDSQVGWMISFEDFFPNIIGFLTWNLFGVIAFDRFDVWLVEFSFRS